MITQKKTAGCPINQADFMENWSVIVLQLLENCETKLVGGLEHLVLPSGKLTKLLICKVISVDIVI